VFASLPSCVYNDAYASFWTCSGVGTISTRCKFRLRARGAPARARALAARRQGLSGRQDLFRRRCQREPGAVAQGRLEAPLRVLPDRQGVLEDAFALERHGRDAFSLGSARERLEVGSALEWSHRSIERGAVQPQAPGEPTER